MKIVLDAGHGYNTAGKKSPDGLKEYEINRAISSYAKVFLIGYSDVQVFFTHNDKNDVPLKTRTDYANSIKADCFISIHANAAGNGKDWNSAEGIETYVYPSASSKAKSLAEKVQTNMIVATGLKNRGVKTANFHVLRETKMASILVECGFMTNKQEAKLLHSETYRKACGEAIAKGIVEEYKFKTIPPPPEEVTKGLYKVQVGAFQSKQPAETLAKDLQKLGYDSYIIYEKH